MLKDHLNLRLLWSAKEQVIEVQVWATLILANLFHGYQVRVAAQAEVEVFDVSLDLLVQHVPKLMALGLNSVAGLVRVGRRVGIIRSSTRIHREVPCRILAVRASRCEMMSSQDWAKLTRWQEDSIVPEWTPGASITPFSATYLEC